MPLLVTGTVLILMLPPDTSALMVPLFTSACVPKTKTGAPMVPVSPRIVVPAAKVVVPLPSSAMRLVLLPSTMVALPDKPPLPSKISKLPWLRLMVPLSTSPPAVTRSMPCAVAKSRLPLSVTPVRLLELFCVAANRPLPLELKVPASVTPFCSTALPAPVTICPEAPPVTLLSSTSVPPLKALRVPLLVTGTVLILMTPPDTSALMVPLFTRACVPPTKTTEPRVPF